MKLRFIIPLVIFAALIGLFAIGLQLDPREVPSPLIDKSAPAFDLPRLDAPETRITRSDLTAHPVSLFNVWASWCVACRQEHPFLMELARNDTVPIYGLNYKDERNDAIAWLQRHGNPYRTSGFDHEGRVGIDWGVYGVPETFVVDAQGVIRYKHIGPLTPQVWREKLAPIVRQLQGAAAAIQDRQFSRGTGEGAGLTEVERSRFRPAPHPPLRDTVSRAAAAMQDRQFSRGAGEGAGLTEVERSRFRPAPHPPLRDTVSRAVS